MDLDLGSNDMEFINNELLSVSESEEEKNFAEFSKFQLIPIWFLSDHVQSAVFLTYDDKYILLSKYTKTIGTLFGKDRSVAILRKDDGNKLRSVIESEFPNDLICLPKTFSADWERCGVKNEFTYNSFAGRRIIFYMCPLSHVNNKACAHCHLYRILFN